MINRWDCRSVRWDDDVTIDIHELMNSQTEEEGGRVMDCCKIYLYGTLIHVFQLHWQLPNDSDFALHYVLFIYPTKCLAIAGRTARCRCKFRYVSNFTTVTVWFLCHCMTFLYSIQMLNLKSWHTTKIKKSRKSHGHHEYVIILQR